MKRRTTPIVSDLPGPLSAEQMLRYERDGFLVVPNLLGADLADRLIRSADDHKMCARAGTIYEEDQATVRSQFDYQSLAPRDVAALVRATPLLAIARQVLGGSVYIHQCHVNYKQAGIGGGFSWHSDFTFWHWEDGMPEPRAMTVACMLARHDETNGAIHCLPGSHRWIYQARWYRDRVDARRALRHDHMLDPEVHGIVTETDLRRLWAEGPTTILGRAGDVLLMDANTVHCSPPNTSQSSREMLFLCLNTLDNKVGAPFSGLPQRPEVITSRCFLSLEAWAQGDPAKNGGS